MEFRGRGHFAASEGGAGLNPTPDHSQNSLLLKITLSFPRVTLNISRYHYASLFFRTKSRHRIKKDLSTAMSLKPSCKQILAIKRILGLLSKSTIGFSPTFFFIFKGTLHFWDILTLQGLHLHCI